MFRTPYRILVLYENAKHNVAVGSPGRLKWILEPCAEQVIFPFVTLYRAGTPDMVFRVSCRNSDILEAITKLDRILGRGPLFHFTVVGNGAVRCDSD